jgi:aspartate aminotransferase
VIFDVHESCVLINSHSKDLGLAGERIGWAVVSPRHRDRATLREAMVFTNRTLGFVNAPALFQRTVTQVLHASVDVSHYRMLGERLCRGLSDAGLEFVRPDGAFYVFPKTPGGDDVGFVKALLKHRILAVPGTGFGRKGYMRLCFSVELKEIEGALPGFKKAVQEFKPGRS